MRKLKTWEKITIGLGIVGVGLLYWLHVKPEEYIYEVGSIVNPVFAEQLGVNVGDRFVIREEISDRGGNNVATLNPIGISPVPFGDLCYDDVLFIRLKVGDTLPIFRVEKIGGI